jgi:hypothetical protein
LTFIAGVESKRFTPFVVGECSEIVSADEERRLRWKYVPCAAFEKSLAICSSARKQMHG